MKTAPFQRKVGVARFCVLRFVEAGALGLYDIKCGIFGDFSLFWCGKVCVEVGVGQLGGWTKCVALRLVFRCCGAEKSGFKLMCLLGRYESSRLPCVRPVNESQWKNVCWTSQVEVSGV